MALCARSAAALVLERVVRSQCALPAALAEFLPQLADPRDRAFAQHCSYEVLRTYQQLDYQAKALLDKPLRARDTDIHMLVLIGLHQLLHLDTPPHAAVSATVEASIHLRKSWAKGLINGVLRRALRERSRLDQLTKDDECVATSHPQWLLEHLRSDWPDDWRAITESNNLHPPMTLRVNQRHTSRLDYLAALSKNGISASATDHSQVGIRLVEPLDVTLLPQFTEGGIAVQDEAAQLATTLLELKSGTRVLDACSAPGGKTMHILECGVDSLSLTAIDRDAKRIIDINANLARHKLHCRVIHADAADHNLWWDGELFDTILLDAPCSAIGVIRRHPDIKLLRKPEDMSTLHDAQLRLLTALWPLLRAGGQLLYVTCSILRIENDETITRFINNTPNASAKPIHTLKAGRATNHGWQILPGDDDMDGFYYADLRKLSC